MKMNQLSKTSLLLAAGLLLSAGAANAASYSVSIDTSTLGALVGTSGPFSLDFILNNGDLGGNNTATISNFAFGGGSAAGTPNLFGGATGSLTTTVTLNDSSFTNEFYQEFVPGSVLSFSFSVTQNPDNITPDSFSIAILDGTDANIPTTDGAGNTLLQFDIDTSTGVPLSEINVYNGTGIYSGVTVTVVPEPSSALCGLLACGLGMLRRRRAA